MAKINGLDKNTALITQVQNKIKAILITSGKMDEDMVTVIDGKKVLTDELEKYKKLKEVIEILNFKDKDEDTLYAFENIYLEKSKQERLFELANDQELNLSFPNAFGEYGEIPNHPGIKCPRPKSILETVEDYEDYLKNYYSKYKIEPQYNQDGLRSEYPHERFEWSKGTARTPQTEGYVHPSYKAYKDWQANKTKNNGTSNDGQEQKQPGGTGTGANNGGSTGNSTGDNDKGKNPGPQGGDSSEHQEDDNDGPDFDGDASDRKKKAEDRTKKRKGLFDSFKKDNKRRVYVKDKKTLKDYLLAPFRKISEADGTLANGQNWPKIKRLLVGAAVVVGGAALISTVGGPLLLTVAKGIFNWPMLLTGALTGTLATSSGTLVTLTVVDRIVMGLVGAAVPAGIIGSI